MSIEVLRKSFLADVYDFRVIFGNEHDAFETDRETGNCIVSLAACLLPLEDKEPGPFLGIY